MPRFDKSGPEGEGPRTGRGLGRCNPENEINEKEMPFARGIRRRLRISRDWSSEGNSENPGRGRGRRKRLTGKRGR